MEPEKWIEESVEGVSLLVPVLQRNIIGALLLMSLTGVSALSAAGVIVAWRSPDLLKHILPPVSEYAIPPAK